MNEGSDVRPAVADEGFCDPFLDIVAATNVQCLEIGVRRRLFPVNGGALLVHRLNVRLEFRPAREPQLTRDDELGVGKLWSDPGCVR